jgi:flagellar biosynthesis/type III secretory pathway M-ring protein FliF/YscJ
MRTENELEEETLRELRRDIESRNRKFSNYKRNNRWWIWFGILVLIFILIWWLWTVGIFGDAIIRYKGN